MIPGKDSQLSVNIQGVNIHYEIYNLDSCSKGPTFLLIHGFLSSTFSFRRLIPLIAKDFHVIALDLPPFGKSEKSKRFTYSYHNLSNIIIEFIDLLQLKDVVLVGHSMGGQISLHVVKKRPEFIRKLVLLCSSSYLPPSKKPLILSTYIPFFPLFLKNRLAKQGVHRNLQNVVFDHSMIDEEMLIGYEQPFYDHQIFHALTKMIRHREGDLSSEELQALNTEALLIWGKQDKVVPLKIGERLHSDLKSSKLVTLDQTGHLLPEEKPHHIFDQISKFI